MNTHKKFLFAFLLLPALFFVSCKKEATKTEYEVLTEYMASNDLDLSDILASWVTSAGVLTVDTSDYSVADYTILDLRAAADFDNGHIKDAHNVALANIITEAEALGKDKQFLVVCYTGQTAARGTAALRLMGYNAKSLKWGMSGWHEDHAGKWNSNAADITHANWVTTGEPLALAEFGTPSISTNNAGGAEILAARVNAMLAADWKVTKDEVLDNPGNYFINNKWPQEAWDEYGHIANIYRIDEDLLFDGLKNLDPSKTIVTYCYTGQTSSITTGWLSVLGYDCRSLLFGANGIVHTKLLSGTAGAAPKKSWKGTGSGSENNLGYYDKDGNMISPK